MFDGWIKQAEYGPRAKYCEELKGNLVAVRYKKFSEIYEKVKASTQEICFVEIVTSFFGVISAKNPFQTKILYSFSIFYIFRSYVKICNYGQ